MKVPISNRLLSCANLVPQGAKVADVGCDHGYLGIHLLLTERASFVHAMDLRPMPLDNARRHSKKYETFEKMAFHVCPGVEGLEPGQVDTIVCAGMGGDTIISILQAASWVQDCTLILQAQSAGEELRLWLAGHGFAISQEILSEDAGKIYTTMVVKFDGQIWEPTLGQQYVSQALLDGESPLKEAYLDRVEAGLKRAVTGLHRATGKIDPARLSYYETALSQVMAMRQPGDSVK